jgi:predicted dehydrogenase
MKIRIGFIGLGAMGLSHVNAIRRQHNDRADISALCASSRDNVEKALEASPKAKTFKDPEKLIASDVHAIFVSTPNFTHTDLAEKIIASGKHLFLEKPCGTTSEECHRLLQASARSERVFMIGHEFRYSPYFQKIKDLVAAGEVGKPHMVWTREFRGPFQTKSGDWIQDDRRSGGCLVDKNCHHFDLMNWWVESKPRSVAAFGGCAVNRVIEGPHQVHDHATVSFEYHSGVRGTLQLCMFALDFPREDLEMGVVGDRGTLVTRISQIEILQWKKGFIQKEPIVHKVKAPRGEGWGSHLGFDEIHDEFLNCIEEDRQPLTTVERCVDGTMMAIAAEESIKKGVIVDFDRWYTNAWA